MMTTMMTTAIAGTAILGGTALATLALGRASASLRHLLWTTALVAVVALPAIDALGVRIEIPVPPSWVEAADRVEQPVRTVNGARVDPTVQGPHLDVAPSQDGVVVTERSAGEGRAISLVTRSAPLRRSSGVEGGRDVAPRVESDGRAIVVARDRLPSRVRASEAYPAGGESTFRSAPSEAATPSHAVAGGPVGGWSVSRAVATVWLIVALLLLAGTLFGHLTAYRLTHRGIRPATEWARLRLAVLAYDTGLRRPIRLVVSETLRVPATWGLTGSTIVLPARYETWSGGTLDRVLLHELAHIRRRDCWSHLVGEIARALHWPNPLAWLAVARQRLESERACDDRVLARGDAASAYAQDLVGIARALRADLRTPRAALAMAGPSGVATRIRSILDPGVSRGRVGAVGVFAGTLAALALTVTLTGIVPVAAQERSASDLPPAPTPIEPVAPLEPADPIGPLEPADPGFAVAVLPEPPSEPEAPGWVATASTGGVIVRAGSEGWTPRVPTVALTDAPRWSSSVVSLRGLLTSRQSQELCVFREGERRSTSYNVDDDVYRIRWETDDCRVEIDMEGDIEFADDDSRITRMGDRALFEIEERIGRTSRRARIEMTRGGIERRYWFDGDRQEWSSEADRWLARILPEIFRHTTINAEARVRRMLGEGGADRVFGEVGQMHSDHVAATYLGLLVRLGDLGDDDYVRVIDATGTFDSDHQQAELLTAVVERAGMRPAFQQPLLRAAMSIDSDHQKARVLETLLDSDLSAEEWDTVLLAAQGIDSDHQLAMILRKVATEDGLSVTGRRAFLETLASIDSDHQQVQVVEAFLDAGPLSADELSAVLDLTANIESDHQISTVLRRVANEYELTGPQVTTYLRAAARMESDHQTAQTAEAVIRRQDFTTEHVEMVLDMATRVESSHQLAMILTAIIQRRDLTPDELDRVLAVSETIDSDHQQAEVLSRVIADAELDGEGVYRLLVAARRIGSDHQQAQVMTSLARRYEIDGEALGLYHDLADGLSRHQRDQVLAAIARRPVG